jgi:hypothetical protein
MDVLRLHSAWDDILVNDMYLARDECMQKERKESSYHSYAERRSLCRRVTSRA